MRFPIYARRSFRDVGRIALDVRQACADAQQWKLRVCLVTPEVAPFTGGGIGTYVANVLKSSADSIEFTVLLFGNSPIPIEDWKGCFGDVNLAFVDTLGCTLKGLQLSEAIADTLDRLQHETSPYDVVEFTDWLGYAIGAIQRKKIGAFQGKTIAIRLHTTAEIIDHFEDRHSAGLFIYKAERRSLFECDAIISSSAAVARWVQKFYRFDRSWFQRVMIAPAPLKKNRPRAPMPVDHFDTKDIVFFGKLQSIKAPDVFVKACVEFLLRNPAFEGKIIFITPSAAGDPFFEIIPAELKSKFVAKPDLTENEREKILSKSLVVFPNRYEAFCYAAFEASSAGGTILLNSNNPAFSESAGWIDGLNCFKFDGSAPELAHRLNIILKCGLSHDRHEPESRNYWEELKGNRLNTAGSVVPGWYKSARSRSHFRSIGKLDTINSLQASAGMWEVASSNLLLRGWQAAWFSQNEQPVSIELKRHSTVVARSGAKQTNRLDVNIELGLPLENLCGFETSFARVPLGTYEIHIIWHHRLWQRRKRLGEVKIS